MEEYCMVSLIRGSKNNGIPGTIIKGQTAGGNGNSGQRTKCQAKDPGDLACKTRVTVDIAVCTEILSEKIFNVLTMQTITLDGGRCAK